MLRYCITPLGADRIDNKYDTVQVSAWNSSALGAVFCYVCHSSEDTPVHRVY